MWTANAATGVPADMASSRTSPKVSVTIDLSKFGAKVTAAVPPAAQVYESKNGSIPGLGGVGA